MIMSEYIDNPLLINGYKFDLRVYLAITSCDPLRLYIYQEGLTRFATAKYAQASSKTQNNRYMHLTNYSVNKANDKFIPNNDPSVDGKGSKWSHTALKKCFKDLGINDSELWDKIEDIMIKALIGVEPLLTSSFNMFVPYRNNCFELLGFDILVDDNLKPWLLEVNLSPSLNCDSPLDQKIKAELISDLFTLTGIVPIDQRVMDQAVKEKSGKFYNIYTKNDCKKVQFLQPSTKSKTSSVSEKYGYAEGKNIKEVRQMITETEEESKRYSQ
jgi:Tubulin-tyrosine ligase family